MSRDTGTVKFGVSSVKASWVWLRVVRFILGRIRAGPSRSTVIVFELGRGRDGLVWYE